MRARQSKMFCQVGEYSSFGKHHNCRLYGEANLDMRPCLCFTCLFLQNSLFPYLGDRSGTPALHQIKGFSFNGFLMSSYLIEDVK